VNLLGASTRASEGKTILGGSSRLLIRGRIPRKKPTRTALRRELCSRLRIAQAAIFSPQQEVGFPGFFP